VLIGKVRLIEPVHVRVGRERPSIMNLATGSVVTVPVGMPSFSIFCHSRKLIMKPMPAA